MKLSRTLLGITLFALLVVAAFTPTANASEPCFWKTKQLQWNGGSFTKSFTASQADTGFVALPSDINWGEINKANAAQAFATVRFVVTGAVAANADTVRYTVQTGGGGVYGFVDTRNSTASISNSATNGIKGTSLGRGSDFGLVFVGALQTNQGTGSVLLALPFTDGRLKVQGDPDGALNSVKVYLTYPATTPN